MKGERSAAGILELLRSALGCLREAVQKLELAAEVALASAGLPTFSLMRLHAEANRLVGNLEALIKLEGGFLEEKKEEG